MQEKSLQDVFNKIFIKEGIYWRRQKENAKWNLYP